MSKYQINDIVRFTAPDGSVKEGYIWRIDVYPLAICYLHQRQERHIQTPCREMGTREDWR